MKLTITIAALAAVIATAAQAEPQTRIYGPDGRSIGTAAPIGDGSTRYFDARGHSLGTSTDSTGTTTYYGPRGNVTGRAVAPSRGR
jgi:hypothetical protein